MKSKAACIEAEKISRIINAAKRVDTWLVAVAKEQAKRDDVDYKLRLVSSSLELHLALKEI